MTGGVSYMIRIAIVEDDGAYRDRLQEYLQQYGKERGEAVQPALFSDGDEFLEKYECNFDIILLDICMPFLGGMDAAEEIRKIDSEVVIIFVTNMGQYAIQGYSVDALDYILKPVNYFALAQSLDRAIGRMKRRERKFIVIPVKGGMRKQDVSQITYIESQKHTLFYHTLSEVFSTYGTMKEAEESLAGMNFYRGNKGYLINLEHVEGVQNEFALVHGERIQLSRLRRGDFMKALADYMGGTIK